MSELICVLWREGEGEVSAGDTIILSESESHHLVRVRRCREGDQVWASTGRGAACRCTISDADPGAAELQINEIADMWREPARRVTLYQALIRPARMELIVEQGTELGMTRLVPLMTELVERSSVRQQRWARIAEETVKQCGRGWIPEISALIEWSEFLKEITINPLIVAHDNAEQTLSEVIHEGAAIPASGALSILVGPEGGLTAGELDNLRKSGAIVVNLGLRRLRSEGAAITILAHLTGA
jgi:16S rRNA (uracil1498-N3)-methyltransferase